MIETLKNFIDLILDKSKRWTHKVTIIISIISVLFIIDFAFKISYNHYLSNKLENLEKIQTLKKDYTSEPKKIKQLLRIENEIFCKNHYSNYIKINNLSISNPFSNKKQSGKIEKTANNDIRDYSWMFVSSSIVFIIIIVALTFMIFTGSKSFRTILNWFSTLIVFLILSIVATWFAYQIPIILGLPFLNYILNFIIHCGFIYLIFRLNEKYNVPKQL